MAFCSVLRNQVATFYNAPDEAALRARAVDIRTRFTQLEASWVTAGTLGAMRSASSTRSLDRCSGTLMCLDASGDFGFRERLPKLQQWRRELAVRPSVLDGRGDYCEWLPDLC